jgi:hypothetical protein
LPLSGSERLRLALFTVVATLGLMIFAVGPVADQLAGLAGATDDELRWEDTERRSVGVAVSAVVLAPLLEETAFRLWLVPSVARLMLASVPLALLLGGAAFGWRGLLLCMLLAPIALSYVPPGWLDRVMREKFRLVLYGSTAAFAVLHLANFENAGSWLVVLPAVLPQFTVGLVLAYLRLRLGFWHGVLAHGAYNAFALTLAWSALEAATLG